MKAAMLLIPLMALVCIAHSLPVEPNVEFTVDEVHVADTFEPVVREKEASEESIRERRSPAGWQSGNRGGNFPAPKPQEPRGSVSGSVHRQKGVGTIVNAQGQGNVWTSKDGNSRVDANGEWSKVVRGPARGKPNYNRCWSNFCGDGSAPVLCWLQTGSQPVLCWLRTGSQPVLCRLRTGSQPVLRRLRTGYQPDPNRFYAGCEPDPNRFYAGCKPDPNRFYAGCKPDPNRFYAGCKPDPNRFYVGCEPDHNRFYTGREPDPNRFYAGCEPDHNRFFAGCEPDPNRFYAGCEPDHNRFYAGCEPDPNRFYAGCKPDPDRFYAGPESVSCLSEPVPYRSRIRSEPIQSRFQTGSVSN